MIKVSFIIPVYKVPLSFLKTCLDSLVSQNTQECEFIIISDGASEAENTICEEYADKDCRIRFYKQNHAGVSAARNFGLKKVRGEYIAFVDADDWIEPQMTDLCYSFAKKSTSDIITMDYFESKNGVESLCLQKPKSLQPMNMLRQIIIGDLFGGVWLRLIRHNFYKQHPTEFPVNLGYCEDIVFWSSFLQHNPKTTYLNKALYHYVLDNCSSITRKSYSLKTYEAKKKYIYALKERLPASFNPEINQAALIIKMAAMSRKLITTKEFMSFEKTTIHTFIVSPLSWKTKIYLILNTIIYSIFKKTYKEYI